MSVNKHIAKYMDKRCQFCGDNKEKDADYVFRKQGGENETSKFDF